MVDISKSLTPPQESVLAVLKQHGKPLSAYAVLDQVRADNIKSPPIVYRALDKLVQLGLVHRLASLNAYIACCQHSHARCSHSGTDKQSHAHGHGHAHDHISQFAICTSCGDVQELDSGKLSKLLTAASVPFLAGVEQRVLEISGTCHDCAANG